ncbi:MAG TPA: hypothetical protein VN031_01150 [Candidatus Microsaccharimonas sp.]|nr:hypothetical protein [Candidatus Microsaccharimonas sp.]
MNINKLIVRLLIIFFILSPAIAWSIRYEQTHRHASKLTATYLYDAINAYNEKTTGNPIEKVTVDSYDCTDTIWCVAKVHDASSRQGSMLFGNFVGDYSKMRVLSRPFTVAFQKNISGGIGVPYSVLNELNSSFGVKQ